MQAWQATVQDDRGNAIPNPVVSVYEADGTTLAAVYNAAGLAIANPVTGNIDGFVQFYAEPGSYKVDSGTDLWEVDLGADTVFQTLDSTVSRPVVQRQRDSVSALDLMSAGGLDNAVRNREATSADAPAITEALQEAVTVCASRQWKLDIPSGRFWLNNRIEAAQPVNICGAGADATDIVWVTASPSEGLRIQAGGIVQASSVSDVTLRTGKVAADYAITIDYSSLISGDIIQPRAESHAKVHRVRTRGTGSFTQNGWLGGVNAISLLGLDIDSCRFNGVYTGAYGTMPQSEAGVRFGGAGSPVQLTMRASMVSAMQDAVYTEDAEGIYLHNCEFVTVGRGYRSRNTLRESGVFLTDLHIATVDRGIDIENMADGEIRGCLIYNAGDPAAVTAIRIANKAKNIDISGNILRRLGSVTTMAGISVDGDAEDNLIGVNTYDLGTNGVPVTIASTAPRNRVAKQNVVTGANPPIVNNSTTSQVEFTRNYTGNLDDIYTDWRMPEQIHTLAAGVTSGPTGITLPGCYVVTRSVDANTATQTLEAPTIDRIYRRRRSGGIWTAWRYVILDGVPA